MKQHEGRPFDIVLWGASGFTGRLVAEYLIRHAPHDLRLALAGRNGGKLEALRAELSSSLPRAAHLPILIADARDAVALGEIVGRTRVVCTTVGPYAKYGRELVAACARLGVHSCDLAGEVPFMRETIDLHDAEARGSGARIVNACGYDSVPSDLGVFLAARFVRDTYGLGLAEDHGYFGAQKGGLSGGTAASLLHGMEQAAADPLLRELAADPYALLPNRALDRGPAAPDQTRPEYSADLGRWTAPFIMAIVNTRVVRRSNALLGGYGSGFRYQESMSMPKGAAGRVAASALSAALTALYGALAWAPTRQLLEHALPSPGQGPSKAQREAGYFVTRHIASSEPDKAGRRFRVLVTVRGTSDPGYAETAKMLGESALCLACDPLTSPAGVSTPAAAMGSWLIERLQRAGMAWEVQPFDAEALRAAEG
jgi:short subunit dehydrogenase-like uncharacterized protein